MSRKKHAEAHENHERWLVSYADFITLLFAFFVVMYSVSSVNAGKFRVLSDSMILAFRSTIPNSMKPIQLGGMVGTPAPQAVGQPNLNPGVAPDLRPLPTAIFQRVPRAFLKQAKSDGPASKPTAPLLTTDIADGEARGDPNLAKVVDKLQQYLSDLIRTDMVNLRRSEFWVEVEIKNSVLFASGSALVNPEALEPLTKIADILREIPNRIQVEGFTDNRPINTPVYPSNWELSASRAANVVHVLMNSGVRPERMSAIGYGEYQPIADNKTEQGRMQNRRVVLVIMGNTDVRYPADFKQANSVPPTTNPAATLAEASLATGKAPNKIP
jgi:chemotaxis protein MotB